MIYDYLYSSVETVRAADEHTRRRWAPQEFDTGVYQTLPQTSLLLTCKQLCSEGLQYYEKAVASSWDIETDVGALTASDGPVLTEWHYFAIDVKENVICNTARFALRTYRVGPRRVRRVLLTVTLVNKYNHVSRCDGIDCDPIPTYWTREHAVFGISDMDERDIHSRDGPFLADCSLLTVFSKVAPDCNEPYNCSDLYGSVIAQALRQLHGAAFAGGASAKARHEPLARVRECLRDRQPEVAGGDCSWSDEDKFQLAYGNASHDAISWAAQGVFAWERWCWHGFPVPVTTNWTRPKPVTLPDGIIVEGFEADEDLF